MLKRLLSLLLILCTLTMLVACGNKEQEPDSSKKLNEVILSFGEKGPTEVYLEEKFPLLKRIDGEDGNSWSVQGGTNDGKYYYFVMNEHPEEGDARSRIYKIDLTSWEIVKISGDLELGHGNNVTYMPKEHQLVVSWCEDPADRAVIVDAGSLEIISQITYPQTHPCMTYSPDLDRYAFISNGSNSDLSIYDGNMNLLKNVAVKFTFASQCLTCDEKLIYFLSSPISSGAEEGYISVYNWDGEYQFTVTIPTPYETENISVYGDKFILAVNDHHDTKTVYFYELSFTK